MIAMMDVDQSGKLGFDEFQTLINDIAKWKSVFKLYDQSNTGRLRYVFSNKHREITY
jgi:calpain, invertebrate